VEEKKKKRKKNNAKREGETLSELRNEGKIDFRPSSLRETWEKKK
jgi:hypothetical protein